MPDVEALANDVLCHFLSKGMDEVLACGDLDEPPQQQRIEHLKRLGEKKGLKVSACDTLKGGKHYRGVIERMKSGKSTKFGVFVSDGHLSSAALCGSHHGTRVGTPCHLGRGGLLKGDRSPSGGQWVGGS